MELVFKGNSRCFVFREEDIEKVNKIIKEFDNFEYDYMPTDWITVWNNKANDFVYNGKFDINVPGLIDKCGQSGIGIIINSTTIENGCY